MSKFDPNKPNNNMPKLPFEVNFKDSDLLIQLNKTNIELVRLNEMAKRMPNQEILLDFVSIKEWVNSNEIENINTTIKDAFIAELEKDEEKIKKADKETIHYKDAVNYWYSKIEKIGFLSTNDYEKINNILLKNTTWIISSPNKKITKWNKILYTPPQWINLIRNLLKNFEDYYNIFNEKTEIDSLLKLPILHYQFEAIHPFSDWNGRTWRIIAVLYLVLHKKLDLPILFLSDYIFKYKDEYYNNLKNIDNQEKWAIKNFIHWMLAWIEIQAMETRIIIYKIFNLSLQTIKQIKENQELNKMYSKELIDFLFIRPFYNIEW
jgi:Fic family protein